MRGALRTVIPVKLDAWAREILCDPISKTRLRIEQDCVVSDYGRRYPLVDGVFDLRALTSFIGGVGELWHRGQADYERWSARAANASDEDYARQRQGVEDVYREIPISGRCLDVGGNDGRLRAFLDEREEYISIDPYLQIVHEPRSASCKRVYPFIDQPLNFLAAFAEHLPFSSETFDTVHMRSVLDHFLNPELALREGFRVLRRNGSLIVGLYVRGGRTGRVELGTGLKGAVRLGLRSVGIDRFMDHHMWHPSFTELCRLIGEAGFQVQKCHWQKSEHDRVCYLLAVK
jgi:SAM-dependent methyltransferase